MSAVLGLTKSVAINNEFPCAPNLESIKLTKSELNELFDQCEKFNEHNTLIRHLHKVRNENIDLTPPAHKMNIAPDGTILKVNNTWLRNYFFTNRTDTGLQVFVTSIIAVQFQGKEVFEILKSTTKAREIPHPHSTDTAIFQKTVEHLSLQVQINEMRGNIIWEQNGSRQKETITKSGSEFKYAKPIIVTSFGVKNAKGTYLFSVNSMGAYLSSVIESFKMKIGRIFHF